MITLKCKLWYTIDNGAGNAPLSMVYSTLILMSLILHLQRQTNHLTYFASFENWILYDLMSSPPWITALMF